MSEFKSIAKKYNGELFHLGFLVRDKAGAEAVIDQFADIEEWTYGDYEFTEECLTVGAPFKISCAFGQGANGLEYEVVGFLEGPGSYMEQYLDAHGEGLHHMAYRFPDRETYWKVVEECTSLGWKPVHQAEIDGQCVTYLEAPACNIVIEVKF